jgi:hypothetical protein
MSSAIIQLSRKPDHTGMRVVYMYGGKQDDANKVILGHVEQSDLGWNFKPRFMRLTTPTGAKTWKELRDEIYKQLPRKRS